MFLRAVYVPSLANLLQLKLRYLGDKSSLPFVEMLREFNVQATINLKSGRDRQPGKGTKEIPKCKV